MGEHHWLKYKLRAERDFSMCIRIDLITVNDGVETILVAKYVIGRKVNVKVIIIIIWRKWAVAFPGQPQWEENK